MSPFKDLSLKLKDLPTAFFSVSAKQKMPQKIWSTIETKLERDGTVGWGAQRIRHISLKMKVVGLYPTPFRFGISIMTIFDEVPMKKMSSNDKYPFYCLVT